MNCTPGESPAFNARACKASSTLSMLTSVKRRFSYFSRANAFTRRIEEKNSWMFDIISLSFFRTAREALFIPGVDFLMKRKKNGANASAMSGDLQVKEGI